MQNKKRPWPRGKPMACHVTVTDTYAESHIGDTATEADAADNQAATNKIVKHNELASTHIFYSVAIVTGVPGITGLLSLSRKLADGPH